ncbi:MAG TPA: M1 family aminopeptidase [Planctomycetota bacterium]|nr:M1 family aminopeptidase [Planctomycetota bacterium]
MSDSRPFCPPDTPPTWIRPRHFRISHVDLAVTVDVERQRVEGVVEHHVTLLPHGEAKRTIELDQHELAISAVAVNGKPAEFSLSDGRVAMAVPTDAGTTFVLRVTFVAERPQKGMFFIAADVARGRVAMAWTQGAMEDHSHWFPGYDSPNNLSTYRIAIRHRANLLAAANGDRESRTENGDGWATTIFQQRKAHVLYLVNVAVGDFVAVDDPSGSVPITHYVPRGYEAGALAMFRSTAFAIRWLGDFIGVPYVWSRYGHVVVHGFMWGGMENTTLTTITDRGLMDATIQVREDLDIDSLVVHELVHQWFGDLLTMKAWSDIWLNESFATYLEARGTAAWRASRGDGTEADVLALELWNNKQAYLDEDSGRYRRPLVTNRYADAYELFDRVAYEKGSLVLHHLCRVLGEDRFRAALKLYTERHAHDLVETADWRQAIEDVTGEPMDWFFAQWVHRAGHPILKVSWRHDPARSQLIIDIEQTQAATDAEQVFRLRCDVAFVVGEEIRRETIDLRRAKETIVLACAKAPTWVVVDPAGDLPTEWQEEGGVDELIARLTDGRLHAYGRARAAVVLAKRLATPALVTGLAKAAADGQPELVRVEAITALGAVRGSDARAALLALASTSAPRLRRAVAKALSAFRDDALVAERLEALATADTSQLTAGEFLAARGALERPGATPVLRAWLKRDGWNQRLRAAVVRGLGACGEAAAIDDVLGVLADDSQLDVVLGAAAAAAAQLGARHLPARDRVRRAVEQRLDHQSLAIRSAAARALGALGDAQARGAVGTALDREPFGNVRRVYREALEQLGKAAAVTTATAELTKRLDDLEKAKKATDLRLEALEKRLDAAK